MSSPLRASMYDSTSPPCRTAQDILMTNDSNRSLDLTEILSRLHRQALLVGGPHDGKRAPLPPIIRGHEHPLYLCQPGRSNDQTWYHYQRSTDTNYVYKDHCDTLPGWPHHPEEIPDEQERSISDRWLLLACAAIVLGCASIVAGLMIGSVLSVFFP